MNFSEFDAVFDAEENKPKPKAMSIFTNKSSGTVSLKFGKHKGKPLAEVPNDYFKFLLLHFQPKAGQDKHLFRRRLMMQFFKHKFDTVDLYLCDSSTSAFVEFYLQRFDGDKIKTAKQWRLHFFFTVLFFLERHGDIGDADLQFCVKGHLFEFVNDFDGKLSFKWLGRYDKSKHQTPFFFEWQDLPDRNSTLYDCADGDQY